MRKRETLSMTVGLRQRTVNANGSCAAETGEPENVGNLYDVGSLIDDLCKQVEMERSSRVSKEMRRGIVNVLAALLSSEAKNADESCGEKRESAVPSQFYGFFHYLSSNPDFGYLCTYFIRRFGDYRRTLGEIKESLTSICADINVFATNYCGKRNLRLVFDGFLSVSFEDDRPVATLEWDEVDKLYGLCHRRYDIAALKGAEGVSALLSSISRTGDADICKLMEDVNRLLKKDSKASNNQ